jgi:alkanesulfonate monooxygenase SsuD/methylene tetrahydromethanopterin reductase-like flavin-dependent oxidoreductase (luciferase family)
MQKTVNCVNVFSWHFMPWPYLDDDFDKKYESAWITVPNSLFDRDKMRGLYQEYLDELSEADTLGYDGVVLNEHHQNIYGIMPSPNLLTAALTQTTKNCKLVVLGNLLPLSFRPLRVAEEYAMLDCMSNGRIVAGFAPGGGHEAYSYSYSMPLARERFWEAVDLIVQSWTQPGPTSFEGKHYSMRYVNPWPLPLQRPHPPIWIPGSNSVETMYEVARRGFCYFLSTRGKLQGAKRSALRFGEVVGEVGKTFHPHQMGLLFSVFVGETDESARKDSEEAIFYFTKNCLKGHQRRAGRRLTMAPGGLSPSSWKLYLENSVVDAKMLGDAETWQDIDDMGSIFVGSPETVFDKLWEFVSEANIGNLLIQFHIGNLSKEKTLNNQRLFAEKVMPRLRAESEKLFGEKFPIEASFVAA